MYFYNEPVDYQQRRLGFDNAPRLQCPTTPSRGCTLVGWRDLIGAPESEFQRIRLYFFFLFNKLEAIQSAPSYSRSSGIVIFRDMSERFAASVRGPSLGGISFDQRLDRESRVSMVMMSSDHGFHIRRDRLHRNQSCCS